MQVLLDYRCYLPDGRESMGTEYPPQVCVCLCLFALAEAKASIVPLRWCVCRSVRFLYVYVCAHVRTSVSLLTVQMSRHVTCRIFLPWIVLCLLIPPKLPACLAPQTHVHACANFQSHTRPRVPPPHTHPPTHAPAQLRLCLRLRRAFGALPT